MIHDPETTLEEIPGRPLSKIFLVDDLINDYAEEIADGLDPRVTCPLEWALIQLDAGMEDQEY